MATRPPANIRVVRGYVDTEWGQVHYRRCGRSGPALTLFHESPLSSIIFERVLPLLAARCRAWAFDTPGYGGSDPPNGPLEIPDYAARLLAAVDALGIDRFDVVGVHTGASIALEVAHQAGAGRVERAIFSGLPVLTGEERARFLASWAPALEVDAEGKLVRWSWDRYSRIWPQAPPELVLLGTLQLLSHYERYDWAYNAAFRYDPAPVVRRLESRVLLLNCEHDILAYTDERVAALVPTARRMMLPGLHGQIPWRAPREYADSVMQFVNPEIGSSEGPSA